MILNRFQLSILLLAMIFFMTECKFGDENGDEEVTEQERIEQQLGKTLQFSELPDTLKVAHLVRQWNGCHRPNFIDNIIGLYAEQVDFYGEKRSKMACLDIKRKMLSSYPDYFQRIIGGIKVASKGNNTYECTFTKYISVGGLTAPVPAYLVFQKNELNNFVIIAESDPETDNRVQLMKDSIEYLNQFYSASETEIKGRFSALGQDETLYIIPPDNMPCSDCVTSLFFSNELLPPIDLKGATGANVLNEGDLDGDGFDEFSVIPLGDKSESKIFIYSFKRGQWTKLAQGNINKRELLSNSESRNQAISLAGQGYIFIQEWVNDSTESTKVNVWNY